MNDQLRISDADREAAARELGEHFAMGRVTADEHSERLEQIWAAKTAADLKPVFRDLPRPQAAQAPRAPRPTTAQTPRQREWPAMPHIPFLFKLLVGIVVLAFAFSHLWWALIAVLVYVFVVRRVIHRNRWGRYDHRPHSHWR
jgi:Flp pilus assembly protein TadB